MPLTTTASQPTQDTYKSYPDLVADTNGGKILFATDDFFAVAENMITKTDPIWDESKYTQFGWETRRKRTLGYDWCIIKLGLPGQIVAIDADTAFFTGNNVPAISLQAANLTDHQVVLSPRRSEMGSKATDDETKAALALKSHEWTTILPITPLGSGYPDTRHNIIPLPATDGSKDAKHAERWTHLRVNIHPDGGLARLRVYGSVVPDWATLSVKHSLSSKSQIDLGSLANGGKALIWSNAHYGSPLQLLAVSRSLGMFDGWETSRNPQRPREYVMGSDGMLVMPGSEWAIISLGTRGVIQTVVVDTNHYKGNYPESCEIQGVDLSQCDGDAVTILSDASQKLDWFQVLPRSPLSAHKEHFFDTPEYLEKQQDKSRTCTHIRVVMYPDGGISRLRLFGLIA
ncbi:hypothetical protein BATDEDRAFT_35127 [Batrachochytrium dendrobatidis JAM81]|uniref:Allantoicase domain-containing protein n=2 Tax=Batrachochytrium dendrobatidis TaxID=109871 RepID=F4P3I0_BATDJ|nr:uncharacterized protein BATDEDRAFT_35127 [Batrachochytrium dendrobatidis JAM81]EGF80222.1 hypothetical protein BATDEDRAFT_35127 [Batrachochytrium dendrobatidis JAM81]KAJ8326382.1 Allantoicase [Batrachochytrium dendrobatidis]OAJ41022.1 allantoicase [Batrachochytrium dendrobatidis JEL423]|eukprot:XP_006679114.1 hypothetical protein BATDEDRAFT_35127 [Batrachochytrium dendrobatidis JAM81]